VCKLDVFGGGPKALKGRIDIARLPSVSMGKLGNVATKLEFTGLDYFVAAHKVKRRENHEF
jgi:hypothetical protein